MRSQLESLLYENFIAPRQTYVASDLGCPIISSAAKRVDFTLRNVEGAYKCSYYKPKVPSNTCVVYLHSMGGSRIQSCGHAKRFVEKGIGFASLDFCGSGNSEGSQNSLGQHSKLEAVGLIQHLVKQFGVSKVIIWGRSMGAAIAIKVVEHYYDQNKRQSTKSSIENKIFGLILDSPFYSLNKLIIQIAQEKMVVMPKVFIKAVVGFMKNTIQNVTQCNLEDYELLPILHKINVPVIILVSKQDSTINYEHSQILYNHYPSRNKQLMFVYGSHAETRDYQTISKLLDFAFKNLKQSHSKSYSRQKQHLKQKEKKSACCNSQIVNKKISPQKVQTEMSVHDDSTNEFPNDHKKPVWTTIKKTDHRRAQTQRSSMYVRNPIRQPLGEQIREGNLISVQSIPVKKKPNLISQSKRIELKGITKPPFANFCQVQHFKKKLPTQRMTYQSHEKYEVKRFLC